MTMHRPINENLPHKLRVHFEEQCAAAEEASWWTARVVSWELVKEALRRDGRQTSRPGVALTWEDAPLPIGYGYAARTFFGRRYPEWNEELERRLKADWSVEPPWPAVRHLVRHGYEIAR